MYGPRRWLWVSGISALLAGIFIGLVLATSLNSLVFGGALGISFAVVLVISGLITRSQRERVRTQQQSRVDAIVKTYIEETKIFQRLDEEILKHGPANHFRFIESIGGRLFLTTRRLHFKAHPLNIQKPVFSIPLASIQDVRTYQVGFIIPKGLKIIDQDGQVKRFLVDGRNDWITAIKAAGFISPN